MTVSCKKCPTNLSHIIKRGFFRKSSGQHRNVQKYFCRSCKTYFCEQTSKVSYRDKKPDINNSLFRMMASGLSQRRAAFILGIHRKTVVRKNKKHSRFLDSFPVTVKQKVKTIVFDEMETFEHSKLKPLSIVVAVEEGSRRILAIKTCQMPAKGLLVYRSLKKYGYRKDHRSKNLYSALKSLIPLVEKELIIKSDECPRYPSIVKNIFPNARHLTFKGRRACVVGQGELKAGGFDPLFSLNHTCAMIRDNIKSLCRRTWCTTKDPTHLQDRLNIYQAYHNQILVDKKRPPTLEAISDAV